MNANLEAQPSPIPLSTRRSSSRRATTTVAITRLVGMGRATAAALASRLPGTMHATRVGASATTTGLQLLPDSALQGLAATSVGLGAGFYIAGLPRLVTALAVAPAMVIGAAIALRPVRPFDPAFPGRP